MGSLWPSPSVVAHILVPQLFTQENAEALGQLRLDALTTLLSKSYTEEWAYVEMETSLFALFGLPIQASLPTAAITRLYDANDSSDKVWLRADPVYLQADRNSVLLFDASTTFTLTQLEANQFIEELNSYYQTEGLHFSAPTPTRWYINVEQFPQVIVHPINQVLGKNIDAYLPEGTDKMVWRSRLNEIQMLLHQSSVNLERETRRELPINGVWFWGTGKLPKPPKPRWTQLWSNDPLAQGLARLANTVYNDLPVTGTEWLSQLTPGEHLLTLRFSWNKGLTWAEWLSQLDVVWFTPLVNALRKSQLHMIALYLGNDRVFCVTDCSIRRWWRWQRSWQSFMRNA